MNHSLLGRLESLAALIPSDLGLFPTDCPCARTPATFLFVLLALSPLTFEAVGLQFSDTRQALYSGSLCDSVHCTDCPLVLRSVYSFPPWPSSPTASRTLAAMPGRCVDERISPRTD